MKLFADKLSHRYSPTADFLFQELELEFTSGKIIGIIGPNGAGKTTLLRILTGLMPATAGAVSINSRPLGDYTAGERARLLSFLPQEHSLAYDMSVYDIVALGRFPYQGLFRQDTEADKAAVANALEAVGLSDYTGRLYLSLSGGEQKRVMLARMLATQSDTLILDEPIAALDINHALSFLHLCRELASAGKSIILSIHQLELAYRFCDSVLLLGADNESGYSFGPTKKIMTGKTLSRVFSVKATVSGGSIQFHLKK